MAQQIVEFSISILVKVTSNYTSYFIQTVNPQGNSIGIALPNEIKNTNLYKKDKCIKGDFSTFEVGDLVECVVNGVTELTYKVAETKLFQKTSTQNDNTNTKYYTDEVHELNGKSVFLPRDIVIKFDAFKSSFLRKSYKYCNMLFMGLSGFGKTTIAKLMGNELGIELVKIDMAGIATPTNFIGYDGLKEGNTGFQFNKWIEKMERGDALVVLDEIDKVTDPKVWAILNPLLDGNREISFRDWDIKVGERVGFIGTANYQWNDTASNQISQSLLSRFHLNAEMDVLPVNQEKALIESFGIESKDATKIIDAITKMRDAHKNHEFMIELSTRKTEYLAELISSGAFSIRMAFDLVYTAQLTSNDDTERTSLTNLLNSKLGTLKYDKLS